ncbi:MAG: phenylalanine--tRNA ligase subunit alpha, partial [Planctomycetota bacterium]|nr:phenylalanine--tRNA ligase subunit alpha [Planctomycetota bacterium]MDI6787988.1 phenylalanine--tRNA ligase subunit alpha [Planctomycetota bacterium]
EGGGAGKIFDTTIPGERKHRGHYHPIYSTISDISVLFKRLGFDVVYGPEIETPYYNFEALNVPLDHPSCDAFDTFYLAETASQGVAPIPNEDAQEELFRDPVGTGQAKWLLRSHTSPVQIRTMEKIKPPVRIIVPGKVFRPDTPSPSRFPMFHQVEGLMVDVNITFSHLKGVLDIFCKEMFGKETLTRFRPSFFPFTEPSVEVDISCVICAGRGITSSGGNCSVCRGSGWLEILGCGMVHPNVFRHVKYDSEKYTGFAFGMGVERIAMLKYRIDDLRLFTENHLSFLRQF